MARKPRIHYPGAVYHVILRGNAGDKIFFDDGDRYRLYMFLQYAVEKFRCRIHAFCLMTNHIHLVIQTVDIPLSRIMQNISLRFTKWINFTQSRTGHLFQGRYKAVLIDADSYLLELVRYVHLNPVRAGAASTSTEWRWTGHGAYLGHETLPWLTTEWVLGMLTGERSTARKRYAGFVEEGISESRRQEFHSGCCDGHVLGDDTFLDRVLERNSEALPRITLVEILDRICEFCGCSIEDLSVPGKTRAYSEARALASLLVQENPHLSLTELAKTLKRDVPSLGRAGRRLAADIEGNQRLHALAEQIRGRTKDTKASLTP